MEFVLYVSYNKIYNLINNTDTIYSYLQNYINVMKYERRGLPGISNIMNTNYFSKIFLLLKSKYLVRKYYRLYITIDVQSILVF